MTKSDSTSGAGVFGVLLVSVLIGFPMIAYLWETINALLAGVIQRERLLISLPVLLLFVLYAWLLARVLQRLAAR